MARGWKSFLVAAALLCGEGRPALAARSGTRATDYAPELAPVRTTRAKATRKRAKALRPRARTAPARPLIRPGLRRLHADSLARFASTAEGGAVDIRMGAATRIHIAKRTISLRVQLPGGAGGGANELVLRGRLLGDGASGELAIAFTGADVRRTRGQIQLREAVADVGAIRGTLRLDGNDMVVDVSGLDGVANKSFGMSSSSGARLSLRAAAGERMTSSGSRSVTTLNMTTFDLGDGVEALRWIIEVDEPGYGSRRFEVGGVLDARTRSLHGLTFTPVGGRNNTGARQVEAILERQVLSSLRSRGDDLRVVGGVRQADR